MTFLTLTLAQEELGGRPFRAVNPRTKGPPSQCPLVGQHRSRTWNIAENAVSKRQLHRIEAKKGHLLLPRKPDYSVRSTHFCFFLGRTGHYFPYAGFMAGIDLKYLSRKACIIPETLAQGIS
jgi:hypothetical protein